MIQFGHGDFHILIWSQMHGNEPTSTYGLQFLLEWIALNSKSHTEQFDDVDTILSKTRVSVIMQLNPDGAFTYKRENLNGIDLNRDAQRLSQAESNILNHLHRKISPDLACNLHDQRTIYAAGSGGPSAAISFLAPAADQQRSVTPARTIAMNYIVEMVRHVQEFVPHRVSRYSDEFNKHCVGDAFTSLGTPTILFEAGFIPNDYHRYTSAQLIYRSLRFLLTVASTSPKTAFAPWIKVYDSIPINQVEFSDIQLKNVTINSNGKARVYEHLFLTLKEELIDNQIHFLPTLMSSDSMVPKRAHVTFDCSKWKPLKTRVFHDSIQIIDSQLNQFIQRRMVL